MQVTKARARAGVNATMAVLSGVAAIIAVISSTTSCTVICCSVSLFLQPRRGVVYFYLLPINMVPNPVYIKH